MNHQLAQATRIGDRRSNQDRALVRQRDDCSLLVVADGLGGHAGGELAAEALVRHLAAAFAEAELPAADPAGLLLELLGDGHRRILEAGEAQNPPICPLTTVVAALVQGDTLHWAHAGDSRLYRVSHPDVDLHTVDHTFAMELYQRGLIDAAALAVHPTRNRLSRCLGGTQSDPAIDLGGPLQLNAGDTLLLCSDGFWNGINDDDLVDVLSRADLEAVLEDLVEQAEHATRPYSDNVTAVALRLG